MKYKIHVAFDTPEAELYAAWLREQGHDASVDTSTGTFIDGHSTRESGWRDIAESLWSAYCSSDEPRPVPAPRVQATLLAAGDVEPNTELPCDHPEAGWQTDLFGECVYCCTFCGAELPEPNVKDDKHPSAASELRRLEALRRQRSGDQWGNS